MICRHFNRLGAWYGQAGTLDNHALISGDIHHPPGIRGHFD